MFDQNYQFQLKKSSFRQQFWISNQMLLAIDHEPVNIEEKPALLADRDPKLVI